MLEVADIFREAGPAYRERFDVAHDVCSVFRMNLHYDDSPVVVFKKRSQIFRVRTGCQSQWFCFSCSICDKGVCRSDLRLSTLADMSLRTGGWTDVLSSQHQQKDGHTGCD